jgi:hypothetical protein
VGRPAFIASIRKADMVTMEGGHARGKVVSLPD